MAVTAAAAVACMMQACSGAVAPADAPPPVTVAEAGAPQRPPPAPPAPAPEDAGVDNGAPSSIYPAPHAPPRLLEKLPGPVLAHPTIIPVFYGDDADRAATEALLAALPGSAYWKILGEYGVGDVKIGASVVLAASAPATFSLGGIEDTVASLWTRTDAPAPVPDGTQIYALFFPKQTDLKQVDGSRFCDAGGAYHDSKQQDFAYAIVPHCTASFDDFAVSATHELIEAATDPYPLVNPAWAGTDANHVGDRAEIGDLCDYGGPVSGGGVALFGTTVERMFSNARAATGHDPCVPDIGAPYFGASAVLQDDVVVDDFVLGSLHGKGAVVKVGESKTITLELFSDQHVAPWSVSAQVTSVATVAPSTALRLSFDRRTGENGEKLHLTIERTAASDKGEIVRLLSSNAQDVWSDTIFVGQ